MADKFGSGIINKIINFGMQFTNNQEDREVLEGICNGADSVDAMSLLMGLDVNDDVTYH
jgi:phosphoribosylformylglycinamidine (FGAM) synthase-like amidotransferase family enzyme